MKRRATPNRAASLLTAVLTLTALVVPLALPAQAQLTTSIALLNPEEGTSNEVCAPDAIPPSAATCSEVSDKNDGSDTTYHLTAWTQGSGLTSIVEFEIRDEDGSSIATYTATRAGDDAWEYNWDIPDSIPDGTYRVVALHYTSSADVAPDSDFRDIKVNRAGPTDEDSQAPAETVEITYPEHGGPLGVNYSPQQTGATSASFVMTGTASAGTTYIKGYYSVSPVGSDPEYIACTNGYKAVGASGSSATRAFTYRCLVVTADAAQDITAVALVANDSPRSGAPGPQPAVDPELDDSTDAHKTDSYDQEPTEIEVEPSETDRAEVGTCVTLTAVVLDQEGRPIGGQNVDVHAAGPTDQLKFDTDPDTSSANQPPNAGDHQQETAYNCDDGEPGGFQGDHNRAGTPDTKHVESTSGTNDNGVFTFSLFSDAEGTTQISAWADADDDDVYDQADEPCGNASIGWGSFEAPAPSGAEAGFEDCSVQPAPPPDDAGVPTQIDCEPETDINPVGSSHTITCTVTDNNDDAVDGARVDVEASGANDPDSGYSPTSPDFSCTTVADDPLTPLDDETGTCSFTHGPDGGTGTTGDTGTTTYRAWIDADNNNGSVEADATEGRDEAAAPGATPESDDTDVVEKTWVEEPATLTMTPESDSAPVGVCNPYTITVLNDQGGPVEGAIVDVEQRHASSTNSTNNDEPTVTFCTPTSGPNPSDVDESKGDLNESPDNKGTAGGETQKPTNSSGQVTIGIAVAEGNSSNGTGQVTITAFYETTDNDDPDSGEPQDTSTKTWTAPTDNEIDCSPEASTNQLGTSRTITCVVTDAQGNPVSGETVNFTTSGVGTIDDPSDETDSQGRATTVATSSAAGTQTVTGTIADSASCQQGTCSDSVTITWQEDQPEDPECSDGVDNDNDGNVDFPEDQGCSDIDDDSENTDVQPEETCPGFEGDDRNQVVGTENGETLEGTEGPDIICGLGGDDLIIGFGGDDVLIGGKGNDSLRGDDGNDNLKGGAGKDELRGNAGTDTLRGGRQNDDLRGNAGDDHLDGGAGFDVLRGGGGDDRAIGASGNDTLQGFLGNDTLVGNSGNDTIKGADGRDTIKGGKDNDVLSGGAGPDTINGGPGRDVCAGGPGKDSIKNCEA